MAQARAAGTSGSTGCLVNVFTPTEASFQAWGPCRCRAHGSRFPLTRSRHSANAPHPDTLDPVRIEHRHRPLYATSCCHPSRLPLPATVLIALDARFPPRSPPPNAPSTRTPARPPRTWSPAVVHRLARDRQTLLTCHRLSTSSSANIALANRLPAF
jgi:hypothetical protein